MTKAGMVRDDLAGQPRPSRLRQVSSCRGRFLCAHYAGSAFIHCIIPAREQLEEGIPAAVAPLTYLHRRGESASTDFSTTPELQRLRLYYANMRAIRHVAPSLKPQHLIEFCRLTTLGSEAKQTKLAFSGCDNGLYKPAPDAESAETGKDVEVTDSAYSSIPGVWIDVQAAHTDQRASGASGEDGLAGFAKVISARGPIIQKSAQELPAGLFAFGE